VGDDPGGDGEPKGLRLAIEVAQQDPGLGPRDPRLRVHADPLHLPEVDDRSAIAHTQAGVAVAATSHRHELLALSGEANR
jgi:hypothetical protein